jgi:O-6-methylguanine DNA methyltransferase
LRLPYLEQLPSVPFIITHSDSLPLQQYILKYMRGTVAGKLSCKLCGTPFQQDVWREIQKIEVGQTMQYADVATNIGRPLSYRAVAQACAKNPLPLIVPCHRVVGKSNLGGYAYGIVWKEYLLSIEKRENH